MATEKCAACDGVGGNPCKHRVLMSHWVQIPKGRGGTQKWMCPGGTMCTPCGGTGQVPVKPE